MVVMIVLLVQARLVSDRVGKLLLELHDAPRLISDIVADLGVLGEAEEHVSAAFNR